MKDLHWSLNLKVFLYLKDNVVGSSKIKNNGQDNQRGLTQNMSMCDTHTEYTTKYVGTDGPVHAHTMHKAGTKLLPIDIIYAIESL